MNSSMGDITNIKKSVLTDEIYTRRTQSCVKSKPYIPKKLIPIRPLNMALIKKELEESWNEPFIDPSDEQSESDVCVTNCINEPKENDKQFMKGSEDPTISSVCHIYEGAVELPLRDKCCNITSQNHKSSPEALNNGLATNTENENSKNNSNLSVIQEETNLSVVQEEKENILTRHQKNDSFDLDFSALLLKTPVKINIGNSLSNSTNQFKTEQTKKSFEFATPKVNNIITSHNSSSKNAYFKTPVNSCANPLKRSYTPVSSISSHKISFKLPFDEVNYQNNREVRDSTQQIALTSDSFNTIKVNDVEYFILNSLGKGGSSEVFHGYNVENKCHVAIKSVALQNSSSANSYINEVKTLQRLQSCEKIIKMYDYEVVDSQKKLLVVLEKGGEDLSAILKRLATQQSHLPMYMLLFYWMEMLYAVKQIHSHGIIHSDLKPANFLKADGGLKLIDFGIASSVQTDMTCVIKSVPEGSCNYISPEALNNDPAANTENKNFGNAKYKLHFKSDVWSLGCILYQLVYRQTPFQHINQLWSKLAAIMNPDNKINYPDANWVSPKIINTIQKCLQYNVRLRPSVDELIAEYENILKNI